MQATFSYAIKFVSDMDKAVRYHRDVLRLPLKFQSPEWSEFNTGSVTLALHPASDANPPGKVELGYSVENLQKLYDERARNGIKFTAPPKPLHGVLLANFEDSEGARCSLSGA